MKGFFVTGTDTGVGKTLIACALVRVLAREGLRVVGMKPVAAGGDVIDGRVMNADVVALNAASNVEAPLDLVNPYAFEQPIAPHIAAQLAGVTIDVRRLKKTYSALAALADGVVVEGAGGFAVPLSARADTADLAALIGLPVVIVVGMRLGCLNHALLTASAVRGAGLRIAGWVANHIDPGMPHADDNVAALRDRLDAPLIARVPHSDAPDAERVAELVNVSALRAVRA
jgi:dethiobiotin synthetase